MPLPPISEVVRRHKAAGFPLTSAEESYLRLMIDGLWHSPHEQLLAGGKRYDGRRWDLSVKYGYIFDKPDKRADGYWWRLIGKAAQPVIRERVRWRKPREYGRGELSWEEAIGS